MSKHLNTPLLADSITPTVCLSTTEVVHVDTRITPVLVRLPSSADADVSAGHTVTIVDVYGNLSVNPLTVSIGVGDTTTIDGAGLVSIVDDNKAFTFKLYTDDVWRYVATGKDEVSGITGGVAFSNQGDGTYEVTGGTPSPFTLDTRAASNPYDNTNSGLVAQNTQAAIDELVSRVGGSDNYAGFFLTDGVNVPASIGSNETIRLNDTGNVRFVVNAPDNSVEASVIPGNLNEVLTTTSTGVSWQPLPASTGGIASLLVQGDDSTPRTYEDSEILNIFGQGLLDTTTIDGPQGPVVNLVLTPGADGEVLTTVGGAPAWAAPSGAAAGSFTLAGDTGTAQTVESGDTMTIAGGTGITTTVGPTDAIQVSLDAILSELNDIPAYPTVAGDYRLKYDGTTFSWEDNTTFDNGLTNTVGNVQLGGALIQSTEVATGTNQLGFGQGVNTIEPNGLVLNWLNGVFGTNDHILAAPQQGGTVSILAGTPGAGTPNGAYGEVIASTPGFGNVTVRATDNNETGLISLISQRMSLAHTATFGELELLIKNLPIFADEAAAAPLTTDQIYKTPTGEIRVKL